MGVLNTNSLGTDISSNVANDKEDRNTGEIVLLSARRTKKVLDTAAQINSQLTIMLSAHGVDLDDTKSKADIEVIHYIIQGIMDRSEGRRTQGSVFLDMLRYALKDERMLPPNDTEEVFGDLLRKLDQHE